MSSLNRSGFITSVPFTEAVAEGEDRRAQRLRNESAEFQLQEQQRQAGQEQALDAAIRAGLPATPAPVPGQTMQPATTGPAPAMPAPVVAPPQPGAGGGAVTMQPITPPQAPQQVPVQPASRTGMGGVQAQLQQTPGGGKLALALAQAEQKRRDEDEGNVMRFLSNPNTAHLGTALAQKIGMNLPPELVSNTNFWAGASIAKDLYGDDHAAAQRFTSAFAQMPAGDIQQRVAAATAAAGAPVKKKRFGHVDDGGNIVFYNLENPNDRTSMMKQGAGTLQYGEDNSMYRVGPNNVASPITIAGTDTQLKGQKFRPAASAAANVLVKIGQNSGKLYPADHEGPGESGEAIVAVPATAAARIAVAKGNNQTQITLRDMIGDDQMAIQGARNQGAAAVAGINADARIGSSQIAGQARTDAAQIQGGAARDVADINRAGRENVAQTQGATARDVAETRRAGQENAATTSANARRDVAGTQADAGLERQRLANQGRTDAAKIAADARKSGTASGRSSVYQQKLEAARAAGMPEREALAYANGIKGLSPQQEEKMAHDMAVKEATSEMMPKGADWVQKRKQEILNSWRGSAPAASKPAPAAPAAAAGGAAPRFPDHPDARQAPDGFWYTPDPDRPGKWLRIKEGSN